VNVHKNARLTPRGREAMVRRIRAGESAKAVSGALALSLRTVRKWERRFSLYGSSGLEDLSSRPARSPKAAGEAVVRQVLSLRHQRRTGVQIAQATGVSRSTVFRILDRHGLNRLKALEPAPVVVRYEREHPGELLHVDIKKLGRIGRIGHRITGDRRGRARGVGWEYVHTCVDDASRLAFAQVLGDERKESAVGFLRAAVAFYAQAGVRIQRVMTDNGACYCSKSFRNACVNLGIRHLRTRPYTPKTNGKVERFNRTLKNEWAYAHAYAHSDQRTAALPGWLDYYNCLRPHGSLNFKAPVSRLGLGGNNLLRLYT
jgi:transposase InsO family protein